MYVKEFVTCVCKKFPKMILHKSDFQSIVIPKHWKVTSFHHKMDIIQSVGKYYEPFIEYYGNENINAILDIVLDKSEFLLQFMDSLPYFSAYTDEEEIKHFHVIDEKMIEHLYTYVLMKAFVLYIENIDKVSSTLEGVGSIQEEDYRATLARKNTAQESIHNVLVTYMSHFNHHYETSEPVYEEIKKRTLYAKEKEKIELVRYMSEMSDEERNAEQALRATGQGRWATGQQKGYKEYQGTT